MRNLSAKSRVSFGLVGLAVSALLLAAMLELVPDRHGALREGRTALAEVLAASSTGWVQGNNLEQAEQTLRLAVDRSQQLLSAAMRRSDGLLVLEVGEHLNWQPMSGEHSSNSQIRVPILSAGRRWGELELRFEPLLGSGLAAVLGHPLTLLCGFMALSCFFSFYFYLSKALAQLDPSKAVPGRVRSALDTMAEGLLVIDRGGRVVLANRAFAALVGGEAETLVGSEPAALPFEAEGGAQEAAARFPWIRALDTGREEYDVPMRLRDSEGRLRALMVNCSPVMGASGRPGGVLVSFDDVTELEERGQQLRQAKNAADDANRAKSDFLANMSHEIRTPMNAILGFTDVLRRGYQKDDQESRKYLNTIHSSGTHLLELINDILDLSKVEAGRMEVERVPVAAHRIVHEVVRVLGVKAKEKGVELHFEAHGALPESIESDAVRLRQIVTNLVGNAIKFTERGSVRLVARLDDSAAEPMLELAIKDSGIGIAEDKLGTVFEAFAQADSSVTRRFGGTGLGLPISRRFARALGGDITVSSVPGEGSTFTVRLATGSLEGIKLLTPAEVAQAAEQLKESIATHWTFAPARVLIVDDAPENRALLEVLLADSGLALDGAENGQVALDRIAANDYDLVLMDMQMPVMDGYTATSRLRERGVRIPVIALTAHAMKGYEEECRAVGCDDFVTKPIDIDGLFQTLARWLKAEAHTEPAAKAAARDMPVKAAPAATPAEAALVSALAGNPRMHRAIGMFAARLSDRRNELRKAVLSGDLDTVAELAHWLKGSAGSVGFSEFTEPAARLEQCARAGDTASVRGGVAVIEALAARLQVPGDGATEAAALAGGAAPAAGREPSPASVQPPAAEPDSGAEVASSLARDPRMHPIIRRFHDRLSQRLDGVSDCSDLADIADMGHWIKGSAGTVGFSDFTEPAQLLEQCARTGDASGAECALARVRALAARMVVPEQAASSGVG